MQDKYPLVSGIIRSPRAEPSVVQRGLGRALCLAASAGCRAAIDRKVVALDPDAGESKPELLRTITQAHDGMAGVYGAVLVAGTLRKGDAVELLD